MRAPNENPLVMGAIHTYLKNNGLSLPDDVRYEYIIDGVYVLIDDKPVLRVGLPPVSNYPVRETEHTNRYLRGRKTVAV